eukprot:gene10804-14504_t
MPPKKNNNLAQSPSSSKLSINTNQKSPNGVLTVFNPKYSEAAETYIQNCRNFDVEIDASIVIALQTGWEILQPTKQFKEGSMLPLVGVLEENDCVRKLNFSSAAMHDSRFRSAGNGNSNARILGRILKHNNTVDNVDLSYNGLDDDGIKEICEAIKVNKSITQLNLSSNHFGETGAAYLIDALKNNNSLTKIDLSRNALGFRPISNIVRCCGPKNIYLLTNGNFVFEEILNSVSHGVAFLVAVVGANLLIATAMDTFYTDYHFWACV